VTPLFALGAVAAMSWLFRVTFSGFVSPEHLPSAISDRLDALAPAAFAALVTAHVVGTPSHARVTTVVAMAAAAVVARLTGGYALPVLAAIATFVGLGALR
jgi:branched-subunit amino acid transport protein